MKVDMERGFLKEKAKWDIAWGLETSILVSNDI